MPPRPECLLRPSLSSLQHSETNKMQRHIKIGIVKFGMTSSHEGGLRDAMDNQDVTQAVHRRPAVISRC